MLPLADKTLIVFIYSDFDAAFERGLQIDMTHTMTKGHCKRAFKTFRNKWETFRLKENKVKNIILYLLIDFSIDFLQFFTRFTRQKTPQIDLEKSILLYRNNYFFKA